MVNVCCLDTETTSADSATTRIIELALIVKDLDTWETKLTYERRFNPQQNIQPKAQAVHGISNVDVAKAPLFSTIAPFLIKIFSKIDVFVGHNVIGFDFPVICAELARAGYNFNQVATIVDTMTEGRWATPDGKLPTLGELCWSLNVDYDTTKAHAALYDVQTNLEAFKKAHDLGYFPIT